MLELTLLTENEVVPKLGNPVAFEANGQPAPQPNVPINAPPVTVKAEIKPAYVNSPQTNVQKPMNGDAPIFKIKALSPYQNRWTIKARLLSKGDIKHFRNQKGEGQLCSVVFSDESGDIRATGFGDAVTMFYNILEVGQVYYVSKCTIKMANKQWSTVNNDYEMTFDTNSIITLCTDTNLPAIRYDNLELSRLSEVETGKSIDVIAVVKDATEVQSITTKKQTQVLKRELSLVDMSGWLVKCTLWGSQAESFDPSGNPVVAIKGVKLSDFNGRSLGCSDSSAIAINPDIPQAHKLRGWFDAEGVGMNFQTYSKEYDGSTTTRSKQSGTLADIVNLNLGNNEKPDYLSFSATIVHIRPENAYYPACGNEGCNKKVTDVGGSWRCEKCEQQFAEPRYRYILSASVCDFSGQTWVTLFNDEGEKLLGMTANQMEALKVLLQLTIE